MEPGKDLVYDFIKNHPIDAVQNLEKQTADDIVSFINAAPIDISTQIIGLMDANLSIFCLESMDEKLVAQILNELPLELVASLLRKMNSDKKKLVLEQMSKDKRQSLQKLIQFPERTAGYLMHVQAMTLMDHMNVEEALNKISQNPQNMIHYAYILNRDHKLVGYISLRRLLMFQKEELLINVMKKPQGILSPYIGYGALLNNPHWADLHALPVVDDKGLFLGAVSYRNLRRSADRKTQLAAQHVGDTGSALGELYWIGLSSIAKAVFSLFKSERRK